MGRHRLSTKPAQPVRVDREKGHGVIHGVSLITEGPALGHGFEIDSKFVSDVVERAGNLKARWTHGHLCDDGLGKNIGRWHNPQLQEVNGKAVALADFHFNKLAHSFHPDGHEMSAAEIILLQAEESPDELGASIVFSGEPEDVDGVKFARLEHLARGDIVGDPAANPEGLFAGTGSELSELATHELDRVVDRLGEEKVLAFLNRYWAGRGSKELPVQDTDATMAAVSELRAEVEALEQANASLKEIIQLQREQEEKRQEKIREDFVLGLQKKAVELGTPLTADQIERVESALSLDEDIGRALGDAYLKALEPAPKGEIERLHKDSDEDFEAYLAARKRAMGLPE